MQLSRIRIDRVYFLKMDNLSFTKGISLFTLQKMEDGGLHSGGHDSWLRDKLQLLWPLKRKIGVPRVLF
jgi:hypothetical protein